MPPRVLLFLSYFRTEDSEILESTGTSFSVRNQTSECYIKNIILKGNRGTWELYHDIELQILPKGQLSWRTLLIKTVRPAWSLQRKHCHVSIPASTGLDKNNSCLYTAFQSYVIYSIFTILMYRQEQLFIASTNTYWDLVLCARHCAN